MAVSALAEAPMQKKASPGYFRVMVGAFEVTALFDGGGEIDGKLLQASPADVNSLVRKDLGDPQTLFFLGRIGYPAAKLESRSLRLPLAQLIQGDA